MVIVVSLPYIQKVDSRMKPTFAKAVPGLGTPTRSEGIAPRLCEHNSAEGITFRSRGPDT